MLCVSEETNHEKVASINGMQYSPRATFSSGINSLRLVHDGEFSKLSTCSQIPVGNLLGPEDFTWTCLFVTHSVFLMEYEIDYGRSLLLNEAVCTIELTSKAHSHSDMRWEHTMDPASVVNVRNIQQSRVRVCSYGVTLVSCLQKYQWHL